jgi:hypothetical protein
VFGNLFELWSVLPYDTCGEPCLPCPIDSISTRLGLVIIAQHQLARFGANTICPNDHVCRDLLPAVENNHRLILILEVLRHSLAEMNRDAQLVFRIVEHDSVQLTSMAVEDRRIRVVIVRRLCMNQLASPLVDLEAVVLEVDTERFQAICDGPVRPAAEDAASIGPEGDDVSK